jgi:4-hydroxybenzoate polyprenyltransferase
MKQKATMHGLIRLSRYQEYVASVIFTTLLGVLFSGVHLSWPLIIKLGIVLAANLLAVGFSFMVNDIEDAPDDALSPIKSKRNPVSSGTLSRRKAGVASLAVAFASVVLYSILGILPFVLGTFCLVLGVLYSWKVIRLKRVPGLDLITHGLMLAGLQLACGYFSFVPYSGIQISWVAPIILVISVSMYGELFNEVRDLDIDRKTGITHTVSFTGERIAQYIMIALLSTAAISAAYCTFTGLIPIWVIILMGLLSILFLVKPIIGSFREKGLARSDEIQTPALTVGTISLLIWIATRVV